MSNLRQTQRAFAAAIGLCLGLTVSFSTTGAKETGASPFEIGAPPFKTYEIRLTSLAPAETMQNRVDDQASEPFDLETSTPVKGRIQQKWAGVKKKLPREARLLDQCRSNAEACIPAAKRFLAVIDKALARTGWTRIAEINRAINLSIKATDDLTQYGVRDLWASPLMTFASGAGDCEDYAIAKYVALREAGFGAADLRLVIVHDHVANEDHAVAAVRHEGRWLILDNKTLDIRQDMSIAAFDPLFVIDGGGVKWAKARQSVPKDSWASASIRETVFSGPQSGLLLL
jgi:predicted transglutaminase-like cysteine proteinase